MNDKKKLNIFRFTHIAILSLLIISSIITAYIYEQKIHIPVTPFQQAYGTMINSSSGQKIIDPLESIISAHNKTFPDIIKRLPEGGVSEENTKLTTINNLTLVDPFYVKEGVWKVSGSVVDYNARPVLDANGPKMEISFSGNGKINGINVSDTGSIITIPISMYNDSAHLGKYEYIYSSPVLYSEGHGVLTTENGEKANYTFQGIGHFGPDKKLRNEGSMFFRTSTIGKLTFLNNVVGIYKDEIERGVWQGYGSGSSLGKVWELK